MDGAPACGRLPEVPVSQQAFVDGIHKALGTGLQRIR